MTTYTELVTQIRDYTETSSDVLSDTIVDDFIEHVENKLLRDLDLFGFLCIICFYQTCGILYYYPLLSLQVTT